MNIVQNILAVGGVAIVGIAAVWAWGRFASAPKIVEDTSKTVAKAVDAAVEVVKSDVKP